MPSNGIRKKLFDVSYVDKDTNRELSWFNKASIYLTLIAVGIAVLATEANFVNYCGDNLRKLELTMGLIFSTEILLRIWSVGENPKYAGFTGRLRYLVMPTTLLDIVATVPLLLSATMPNSPLLRTFRLIRLARFANLGRYSKTLSYFSSALRSHWPELVFTLMIALVFLVVSATILYIIEGTVQPEAFGSVPRALWWAVATLTTVGYGDVYPITPTGKFVAAIIAFIGIATVALPAGIFAAAFSEAFREKKDGSVEVAN